MDRSYIKPWGPWLGVPPERQTICAVDGCETPGRSHQCPGDSTNHFHGCVHYDEISEQLYARGLKMRDGWGLLCDAHYKVVVKVWSEKKAKENATPRGR